MLQSASFHVPSELATGIDVVESTATGQVLSHSADSDVDKVSISASFTSGSCPSIYREKLLKKS